MNAEELDRRARLRRHVEATKNECRRLGASEAQLRSCRTLGQLYELKGRMLRELMDAPTRAS